MRWLLILLLIPQLALADGQTPHRIRVTPDHDDLSGYQQTTEFNFYNGTVYLNHALEWESEDDLTIGGYFNNIPLGEEGQYRQTYTYDSYLGVSKWWGQRGDLRFGMAGQIGTPLIGESMKRTPETFLAVTMAQVQIPITHRVRLTIGPYYANPAMTTEGNRVGIAMNAVWFINRSTRVEGSWFTGSNNLSGGIFNAYFDLGQGAEWYLGVQVPAAGSANEFAGIVGIILPLYNAGAHWED